MLKAPRFVNAKAGLFAAVSGAVMLGSAAANAAIVYTFDYAIGDALGIGGDEFQYHNFVTGLRIGELRVTGTITTDGTLGRIDGSNILDWTITFTGEAAQHTVGFNDPDLTVPAASVPNNRNLRYSEGTFEATADTLTAIGNYDLGWSYLGFTADGSQFVNFLYNAARGGSPTSDLALFNLNGFACSIAFDLASCSLTPQFRESELAALEGGTPTFRATVAVIPEPASLTLLAGGLALLGAALRRRKSARASI